MFNNPIVGGLQLIRNSIQSANYIPGVSGWSINRDGTSEFASGTFRGPLIILDPLSGAVLATIGADGAASFQSIEAPDITIDGLSLTDTLTNLGRGIVGQFRTTSNLPNPGLSGSYTDTCWTSFPYDTTRMYRVTASTAQFQNTASFSDQDLRAKVIFNQSGISGGASNETVHTTQTSSTPGESSSLNVSFYMGGPTGRADGTSTIKLQLAASGGSDIVNTNGSTNPFQWTVEDVGPYLGSSGGTGAPSGSLTWTVKYYATNSRSYDGSNTYIGSPDGDNNIYSSTFADRSYTNERYNVVFPGATIRSDLAGATINYARLWLYCFKAEETKGSLRFGVSAASSVPTSWSDTRVSESWGVDDEWPVPGWQYFDLLTVSGGHSTLAEFLSPFNGNSIIGLQPLIPGLAATAFRGYSYSATYRPYIEVQYVGNPPSSATTGYGIGGYGSSGYGV